MITRVSTAAIEAVAMNKPVIVLNLSGEPDPVEYVKEGVAYGVYNRDNLEQAILKLLEEDSLSKSREQYIKKYLYKIDGKATERVVDIIKDLVEIKD
jgi:UDP-N-acetylglucosamine 2-epimerase